MIALLTVATGPEGSNGPGCYGNGAEACLSALFYGMLRSGLHLSSRSQSDALQRAPIVTTA